MPEQSVDPAVGTLEQQTTVEAGVQPLVLEPARTVAPGDVEKAANKKLGIMGWIAVGWLVVIFGAALLAPVLPIPDPSKPFVTHAGEGPQAGHPFGFDSNGNDMFSRVIWGARASLIVSVGSVAFGLLFGGVLGRIAGYYRGKLDTMLS